MIKAVIFDMDGVIVDSETLHYKAMLRVLRPYGVTFSFDYYARFPGNTATYAWETVIREFGLNVTAKEMFDKFMKEREYLAKTEGHTPCGGAIELIGRMSRKYKLAIASGSPMTAICDVVKYFNIADKFECLVSGEEIPRCKPEPDIFLKAAELLGIPPENCAVIEDSHNGVTAAKAAGMYCIGYVNPHSGKQDLSAADAVVDDLAQADEYI